MKLSVSNIAWQAEEDAAAYNLMKRYGYSGLEIAPTRILPENPYNQIDTVNKWTNDIKTNYGFIIPSMQSIWFGRQEKIFGTEEERQVLLDYTKKAITFAEAIGCNNLVFGCPRNRNLPDAANAETAVGFFRELGNYAARHSTVIGMEANPAIYGTNYINDTPSAFQLIEEVNCEGFKLNLDVGTMIQNDESVDELAGKVRLINHVHISEPGLKPIVKRQLHQELKEILITEKYQGFISIEMGKAENLQALEEAARYVKEIFG